MNWHGYGMDIDKEVLKPKKRKIENKGKDVSKWKKAMIGSLGFVTGIGLNVALKAHPVLGTVASAYTLSRTIYNAGKLTCSISTKINKGNEQKILIAHRKVNTNGSLKHVKRCSLKAGVGTLWFTSQIWLASCFVTCT